MLEMCDETDSNSEKEEELQKKITKVKVKTIQKLLKKPISATPSASIGARKRRRLRFLLGHLAKKAMTMLPMIAMKGTAARRVPVFRLESSKDLKNKGKKAANSASPK